MAAVARAGAARRSARPSLSGALVPRLSPADGGLRASTQRRSSSSISGRSTPSSSRAGCASWASTARSIPCTSRTADARNRAEGHHPLRRPGLGGAEGPAVRSAGVSTSGCRCSASATACSSIAKLLGGKVEPAGPPRVRPATRCSVEARRLFEGLLPRELDVWMSHGDRVEALPPGFEPIAAQRNAALRRPPRTAAAHLRRAVPPRGGAHPARQGRAAELPLRDLQGCSGAGR